jgi:SAP domain
MSLYARSDLMSISVPVTSGGCGGSHSRPVNRGAPAKIWQLDCTACESYLRGDKKQKVIHVLPGDKEKGIPGRMVHVADSDPHWSSTPEGIPLTPDEQHIHKIRSERGHEQLQQLQALAALQGAGFTIPPEAQWLLDRNFDARIIKGTILCPTGHENTAGAKFCMECSLPMIDQPAIGASPDVSETPVITTEDIPLGTLHVATLRKKCREKGLDDKGTKDQLISRLETT